MRPLVYLSLLAGAAFAFGATAAPAHASGTVIASGHVAGACLDVRGGSNDLVLWQCHGGVNQQFRFATGSYGQVRVNGNCLQSNGKGQPLTAAACTSAPARRWINTSEGFLRNETGLCADVERGGGAGSRVIGWDCNKVLGLWAATNQRWSFASFYTAAELQLRGSAGANLSRQVQSAAPGTRFSGAGVVSAGGANVVSAGGANVVSAGGLNVIAAGGGNVIVPMSGVVAAGGLN